MERKLTYSEIVKALECCCKDNYEGDCPNCPLQLNGGCNVILAEHALDLINRQKAEIEDLDRNLKSAYSKIERLKKGWTADIVLTADAKAEAIKEFAERFEEELYFDEEHENSMSVNKILAFVDTLVKEMTEGSQDEIRKDLADM